MDSPNPEAQAEAIRQALFNGNKIEAIKLFREQTKVGLAEAKAMVEKLEADLRKESPESFKKPAAKGGCAMTLDLIEIGQQTTQIWPSVGWVRLDQSFSTTLRRGGSSGASYVSTRL